MLRHAALTEDTAFRLGTFMLGLVLTASALLAGDLARGHMVLAGTICGDARLLHCPWCYAAAALALSALSAFFVAATGGRRALRRIAIPAGRSGR